jgi:integrase
VAEQLGHTDIKMSSKYAHILTKEKQEALEQTFVQKKPK